MRRAMRFIAPVLIVALLSGMTTQIWNRGGDVHSGPATPVPAATPAIPAISGTPDSLATPLVSDVSAVVQEEGFTVSLDDVTVSGPPGVASTGVAVRASLVEPQLPDEVSGFAESVGPAVEITLGDNLQPAVSLTITFSAEAVSGMDVPSNSGDEFLPVVISSRDEAPGWEFADAQMLPDGSVAVTASHLSFVQLSLVPVRQFADWLTNQVLIFLQVRSEKPSCADQDTTDIGWEFSPIPDQVIWPCISKNGDGLNISFTNNSPEVWLLGSEQATSGVSTTLSASGMLVAAIGQVSADSSRFAPLIAPDGEVSYLSRGGESEIVFDVQLSDGLTKLNALLQVTLSFIPGALFELIGHAQCLADIVSVVLENVDDSPGQLFSTILGCFADALGGLAKGATVFEATKLTLVGALISAVVALPGALWAGMEAAIREFSGTDHFSITLSRIDSEPALGDQTRLPTAEASGWPTDRDDSAQGLRTWIGASSVWPGTGISGPPDWVACDDARNYCLLGYNDEEHVLVQIDRFEIIGTIADWYPNPKEALLSLGMTDEVADQILGV